MYNLLTPRGFAHTTEFHWTKTFHFEVCFGKLSLWLSYMFFSVCFRTFLSWQPKCEQPEPTQIGPPVSNLGQKAQEKRHLCSHSSPLLLCSSRAPGELSSRLLSLAQHPTLIQLPPQWVREFQECPHEALPRSGPCFTQRAWYLPTATGCLVRSRNSQQLSFVAWTVQPF